MPVRRVHDETGGLVEREQVVVLVQDVEADVFGLHRIALQGGRACGERDGHDVPQRCTRRHAANRRAVHGDLAVLDPGLDAGACGGIDVGQVPPQHEVEPLPGVAAVSGEDARRRGHYPS